MIESIASMIVNCRVESRHGKSFQDRKNAEEMLSFLLPKFPLKATLVSATPERLELKLTFSADGLDTVHHIICRPSFNGIVTEVSGYDCSAHRKKFIADLIRNYLEQPCPALTEC